MLCASDDRLPLIAREAVADSGGTLTTAQEEEALEVRSEGPITRARARAIARAIQSLVARETRDDATRKSLMLPNTVLSVTHEV